MIYLNQVHAYLTPKPFKTHRSRSCSQMCVFCTNCAVWTLCSVVVIVIATKYSAYTRTPTMLKPSRNAGYAIKCKGGWQPQRLFILVYSSGRCRLILDFLAAFRILFHQSSVLCLNLGSEGAT